MTTEHGDFVRTRRAMLHLSQRELAKRAGVKQPLIAAIEVGAREPSPASRAALERALAIRPSVALAARREQVRELFTHFGLPEPRVFGSVARGEDGVDSDVDLLVEFTDRHDIIDLLSLEQQLEALLTVRVDLIDARAPGRVTEQALAEDAAL